MRTGTLGTVTVGLLAVACGGSSMSSHTADRTSIASYQALTDRVQSAALSYGAAMGAPGTTVEGCMAAHESYHAQVRPLISQMVQMSGSMDAFIDAHRGSGFGDTGCVSSAMRDELEAHHQVACTFASLGDDQAEASRHAGVMAAYAAHVYDRCGQMMGGLDGQGYTWGPPAMECGGTSGGPIDDPVAIGERIFAWGLGADGQPIARSGGLGMMMAGGCASCHGPDGHGRTTMMFATPNITYPNLTDPSGMREPDGSRGPTYTDELIRSAVVQGIDPDGSALDAGMPRWQMSDQDWGGLLLFLKTLH